MSNIGCFNLLETTWFAGAHLAINDASCSSGVGTYVIRIVVQMTAVLMVINSVLVIIGFFDALLGWDVFDKNVEAVLYGAFFPV